MRGALVRFLKRLVMRLSTRFRVEAIRVPPQPDPRLLEQHPELAVTTWLHGRVDVDARIRAHGVVDEHLASTSVGGVVVGEVPRRVWMYWDQGWDATPPVVAACRDRLERFADGFDVVLLDASNQSEYSRLPAAVRTNTGANRTAFSEALRFDLLARHGGVWLDATCWLTRPLDDLLALAEDRFFGYRQPDGATPGWLMVAPAGHLIPTLMRDLLVRWWSTTTEHPAYFWYIHLFEAAVNRVPEFATAWRRSPHVPARHGILLHQVFDRPYDARLMELIEGLTYVQKLSYKHPEATRPTPGTFAAHVLGDAGR